MGAGSYHWRVTDKAGVRGFATVDDLDHKPWLGDTRDAAFDGLRGAFDASAALRGSGLQFVVAPIPTRGGESLRRLDERHTVALFPFVDGAAGEFGYFEDDHEGRSCRPRDAGRASRGRPSQPHRAFARAASSSRADATSRRRFETSTRRGPAGRSPSRRGRR